MPNKKSPAHFWMLFIAPFHAFLFLHNKALFHATLLAKKSKGTLTMGPSGSGKSTLALAGIMKGYQFFGDDHPIVYRSGNKIMGKSFISQLALSRDNLKLFPDLKKSTRWDKQKKKFCLNPWDTHPESLGKGCEINKILFPVFNPKSSFEVKKMRLEESLLHFSNDWWNYLDLQSFRARKLSMNKQKFIHALCSRLPCYKIHYSKKDLNKLKNFVLN